MKIIRLFMSFLLCFFCANSFGQKSYVSITHEDNNIYLEGDVPSSIKYYFSNSFMGETILAQGQGMIELEKYRPSVIINLFAQEGFTIEFINSSSILMSKDLMETSTSVKKNYIEIRNGDKLYVYGDDIPSNLDGFTYTTRTEECGIAVNYAYRVKGGLFKNSIDLINYLTQYGFIVDCYGLSGFPYKVNYVLMSRDSSSTNTIQHVPSDSKQEVEIREVARYNLQGMPIGKHEKGTQIIVYSDYTTRTVVVE